MRENELPLPEAGEERRLIINIQKPKPIICTLCKKELHYQESESNVKSDKIWLPPNKCDCAKATKYYEIIEEDEVRIKAKYNDFIHNKLSEIELDLMSKGLLGKKFLDKTFDNFKKNENNKEAFNQAYKLSKQFDEIKLTGRGLGIMSKREGCTNFNGIGKTHLAYSIANFVIKHKKTSVIACTLNTILNDIQKCSRLNSQMSVEDCLAKYINVELLVIDEMDKINANEWSLTQILLVINGRYENKKSIVFTTVFDKNMLKKFFQIHNNNLGGLPSNDIFSRLNEMCKMVEYTDVDHR